MAEHQVRLLTRMVDDLLDTSRITRGTFQLQKERVRPAELIERAVDTVRHLAEATGASTARRGGPGPAATGGRPGSAGAGHLQPPDQCRQVHAAGRTDRALCRGRGG